MTVKSRETETHVYFLGGPLSQWYPSMFEGALPIRTAFEDGYRLTPGPVMYFKTAEHFMMAAKASIFGDEERLAGIMKCDLPSEAKALGRKVADFDDNVWKQHDRTVVYIGTFYKFTQNKTNRDYLLSLDGKTIVEGSRQDGIWGVKLDYADPLIEDEANWLGTNYLGNVHMRVIEDIKANPEATDPWPLVRPW